LALALLLSSLAAPARAGEGADAGWFFRPPADPFGHLAQGGAEALRQGEVFAAAWLLHAQRPAATRARGGGRFARSLDVADLTLGAGALDLGRARALAVGIGLPVIADARGEPRPGASLADAAGLGPLRTEVKLGWGAPADDAVALAARARLTWPTGDDRELGADGDGLALLVEGGVELQRSIARVSLFAGYEWIEGAVDLDAIDGRGAADPIRVDDRLQVGLAVALAPLIDLAGWERLELCFEVRHAILAADPYARSEEAPAEIGLGVRFLGERLFLAGGGLLGLDRGFGAARRRVVVGVGMAF
jgi:hypothetical protein